MKNPIKDKDLRKQLDELTQRNNEPIKEDDTFGAELFAGLNEEATLNEKDYANLQKVANSYDIDLKKMLTKLNKIDLDTETSIRDALNLTTMQFAHFRDVSSNFENIIVRKTDSHALLSKIADKLFKKAENDLDPRYIKALTDIMNERDKHKSDHFRILDEVHPIDKCVHMAVVDLINIPVMLAGEGSSTERTTEVTEAFKKMLGKLMGQFEGQGKRIPKYRVGDFLKTIFAQSFPLYFLFMFRVVNGNHFFLTDAHRLMISAVQAGAETKLHYLSMNLPP